MRPIVDHPALLFGVSLGVLWSSAWLGTRLRRRSGTAADSLGEDYNIVLTSALTLLALIIGFSFSMAISRYDLRKNYEEAEANAVGTEYLRAALLSVPAANRIRELLKSYTEQRVLFYRQVGTSGVAAATNRLQNELWDAILPSASAAPTPVVALVASGMNDVINSQGYTQAAWLNRIPVAVWVFLTLISVLCNLMVGYQTSETGSRFALRFILPFALSISFILIADIDSPGGGLIRVQAQNLLLLQNSLQ
jgi:hypothetical protein